MNTKTLLKTDLTAAAAGRGSARVGPGRPPGVELDEAELALVAGGSPDTAGYSTSLATAGSMVAGAVGLMVTAPVLSGVMAAAAIGAAASAIYYGLQ